MLLRNLFENTEGITERQVWAKSGQKIVRKYKCSAGKRKGRVVKNISQCFAVPDIKKRAKLKMTRARLGKIMTRRANITKKKNPISKRVRMMNRSYNKRK